jgi:hypothetical protein
MSDTFTTVQTELPRDRWGRPLITPKDGGDPVAYQRCTTFVGCLEDTYNLSVWQQTMVALGMARRRDLVLSASAISDPKDRFQKRTLKDIARQAIDAAHGGAAAATGTALHAFSEQVDAGTLDWSRVPEEYVADLKAYEEVMRPFTILAVEGFCVVDDLRVGGSYDRILGLPEGGLTAPDGTLVEGAVIGDLKTGATMDFGMGKIAQQLGVYANAEDYNHTLGTRTPLVGNPSKRWGIVIHLPAGTGQAHLLWVNIEAGWETARTLAVGVHAWRKRKDLHFPLSTASVTPKAAPSLVEQINAAASYEELSALYAQNASRWTPGLTSLAAERKTALS